MWRYFDPDVVDADLAALSSHGVRYMRVFPNWRDFQPVMPLYGHGGSLHGYALEGEREPENPYYLDEKMMGYFDTFLDICDKYNIKLVVGLITGWMSGRLYVPSALYGKNVIVDSEAIYFEQLFIKGFVTRFCHRDAIYAWDLGNECNCLAPAGRAQAATWTALISNAIKAADPSRKVVSGMHSIEVDVNAAWQIRDQAEYTDILTTHPYPYWCDHTRNDKTLSLRTTMHATAQNKYYSECGNRPCMAEEIGTMGPMVAGDAASANFLRTNLFSLWANGSAGVMWWCGHDQTKLSAFPYSANMVETELGLLTNDREAKPVLLEIKSFCEFLERERLELPCAETDAVCLLTHGQRQWGVCYSSHILARRAGLNLRFAYADDGIPQSDCYLMPSVNGIRVMDSAKYHELMRRVHDGARLYISMNNGVLSELESLVGMRVVDSFESPCAVKFSFTGKEFSVPVKRRFITESTSAEVLASDADGNPVISVNSYGKGQVYFVNVPIEDALIDGHNAFDGDDFLIYKTLLGDLAEKRGVKFEGEGVFTTYHKGGNSVYTVSVNHTGSRADIRINTDGYRLKRLIYGNENSVAAYDATVLELEALD